MSVFKYHAFIFLERPPPWYGTRGREAILEFLLPVSTAQVIGEFWNNRWNGTSKYYWGYIENTANIIGAYCYRTRLLISLYWPETEMWSIRGDAELKNQNNA
jgi:hypothetical protein